MEIGALVKELQSGISARGTSGYWEMPRVQGRGGADGAGGAGGGGMPRITWSFDSGPARPRDVPDRRPVSHHRGRAAHRCRARPAVRRHRGRRHRLRAGKGCVRSIVDRTREADGRDDLDLRSVMLTLGRRARAHDRVRRVPRRGRRVLRRGAHVGRGAQLRHAAAAPRRSRCPMDHDGLDVDVLEAELARLRARRPATEDALHDHDVQHADGLVVVAAARASACSSSPTSTSSSCSRTTCTASCATTARRSPRC